MRYLLLARDAVSALSPAKRCLLSAREAGVSIKPGAQAPGSPVKKAFQPAKRATDVRAVAYFAGLKSDHPLHRLRNQYHRNTLRMFEKSSVHLFQIDLGACAAGFMLSPASQA
jgi:hypothetical protein